MKGYFSFKYFIWLSRPTDSNKQGVDIANIKQVTIKSSKKITKLKALKMLLSPEAA